MISLENTMKFISSQPSIVVAKGKISFATMTHGCEAVKKHGNRMNSENQDLSMNLSRKSYFHFSFFKVNPKNAKFNLEYINIKRISPTHFPKKKTAAQAADADPSRCNSTNRQNPPLQENFCYFNKCL